MLNGCMPKGESIHLLRSKMRKFNLILTIIVLAAMMLTACGGEETSTTAPGTTPSPIVPPVTADTTATGEVPSTTETVSPTDGTGTAEIPVTGADNPARLSNQLDFTVWNQNGEQIGEVDDMVIDLDNTRIAYVVVGTGGFLDLGEKEVLVPWNSLKLQTSTGDATGGEQNAFILQADQELFNNAPDVDLNSVLPEMGQSAGDWDQEIRTFWENGVVPNTPAAGETATTAPGVGQATATTDAGTGQGQATATAGTGQGQGQGQAMALQGVVLASDVLGTSIALSPGQGQGQGNGQGAGQGQATATAGTGTGQATATPGTGQEQATATPDASQGSGQGVGNFNGTLDDAIVDTDTGDILYLVVNTTLDDGERWIPIPLSLFQWDADNSILLLNVNPATLRDAPSFTEDQFPDTTVEGWNSEFDTFWQTAQPNP
jgi:sporulation protein YlmC with PRC-barrel domain